MLDPRNSQPLASIHRGGWQGKVRQGGVQPSTPGFSRRGARASLEHNWPQADVLPQDGLLHHGGTQLRAGVVVLAARHATRGRDSPETESCIYLSPTTEKQTSVLCPGGISRNLGSDFLLMKCQIILGLSVVTEPLCNRCFVLQMTRFSTLKSLSDKCQNLDRFPTPTREVADLSFSV